MSISRHDAQLMGQPGLWEDSSLRGYLGSVNRRARDFTSFSCLPFRRDKRKLEIDYVPVSVRSLGSSQAKTIFTALVDHPVAVLSSEHEGLSLLCKHVTKSLSEGSVGRLPKELVDFMPIYLDLATLDKCYFQAGLTLDMAIPMIYEDLVDFGSSSFLTRATTGGAIYILDNLDALDSKERAFATTWVKEAIEMRSRVLVATRDPYAHGLSDLPVIAIADDSTPQLMAAMRLGTTACQDFMKQLSASTSATAMAQSPATLSMMLDVFFETQKVPDNHLGLAREFLRIASLHIKAGTPARMVMPMRSIDLWISRVAYEMHTLGLEGQSQELDKARIADLYTEATGDQYGEGAAWVFDLMMNRVSLFIRGRSGLRMPSSITAVLAAQHVAGCVVSPAFVLGKQAAHGVSKEALKIWGQDPSWQAVLTYAGQILEADRSIEWQEVFYSAIGRPAPSRKRSFAESEGPSL